MNAIQSMANKQHTWQWALTHTLLRIKVSFSNPLGNYFLDQPDTFEYFLFIFPILTFMLSKITLPL